MGGEYKSLNADPDVISWFNLEHLVENNVGVKHGHYLNCLLHDFNQLTLLFKAKV